MCEAIAAHVSLSRAAADTCHAITFCTSLKQSHTMEVVDVCSECHQKNHPAARSLQILFTLVIEVLPFEQSVF